MTIFRLRNYFPRSLMGRTILILVIPVILIQLVVGFIFIDRLFSGVSENKTKEVANQISYILSFQNEDGLPQDAFVSASQLGLKFKEVGDTEYNSTQDHRPFYDFTGIYVDRQLRSSLGNVGYVILIDEKGRKVRLGINSQGRYFDIVFDRIRASAPNPHQLLVAMVFASLILTMISFFFLRNQIRPINKLSRSLEAFGQGEDIPIRARGATEVRVATTSFQRMKDRINRQIEQRTMMLSGVSHDLRTPLTRLKLSLSLLDDASETAEMVKDINDMEKILDEFLNFTKGDSDEQHSAIHPKRLAKKIKRSWDRSGKQLRLTIDGQISDNLTFQGRELSLTRAIDNLIGNAFKFAKTVELTLVLSDKKIEFAVSDDGPGIAKKDRETAVKPFSQLDYSRNQNKGPSSGLGLAITADIARNHGGALYLGQDEKLGGLKASIVLPI